MLAASDVGRPAPASSRPGSGVVPRRPASRAAGSVVSRRGRVSRIASGWPSSQSSRSPNERRSRRRRAAGYGSSRWPAYWAASARFRPPTPIRRTWPSQSSWARLVIRTALEEWSRTQSRKSFSAAQPASSSGGVAPAGSGISRTDSKLSHTSSTRYCASSCFTASSRWGGSRRAKSAPNTSRPSSVITPSRPKLATPGSNECQSTRRGSSTPPVSRHQRAKPLASSVFPVPPGPARTTTRCSRAAVSSW